MLFHAEVHRRELSAFHSTHVVYIAMAIIHLLHLYGTVLYKYTKTKKAHCTDLKLKQVHQFNRMHASQYYRDIIFIDYTGAINQSKSHWHICRNFNWTYSTFIIVSDFIVIYTCVSLSILFILCIWKYLYMQILNIYI